MSFIETLNEKFPIRRKDEQKKAFRDWFVQTAREMGYDARVEVAETKLEAGGGHQNVVVGNPETAQAIFTAHYDTPASSFLPNVMTPRNRVFFWCYQMLQVLILVVLGVSVGVPLAAITGEDYFGFLAGYAVYMALLFLMIFGPANKHNVNDNTSGVAAILELMARIPEENRAKAAFILFDNEEKGCRGSKAYAKAHPEIKENGFIVNLDCVGDGEHILVLSGLKARELPQYDAMSDALKMQQGRKLHLFPLETSVFNSDQKNFKTSTAVCACNEGEFIGYCCDRIHTSEDTVCEQANLDFLADGFAAFVGRL